MEDNTSNEVPVTEFQLIKTTESGRVARLTLARPPLNVLNIAMLTEMNTYLESLISDSGVSALVINGEGRMFSSGVDVPEHKPDMVDEMIGTFHRTFRLMHQLPIPTIAAVHGGAYGGALELAIFCDIVLAADDARLGVPEIKLGVFPPLAIAHLASIVGVKKAAELIFTGDLVDAQEALRIGLVNHVYPAEQFAAEVDKFVGKFSKLSGYSLRSAKDAFRKSVLTDFDRSLQAAETVYLKELMRGSDPTEGLVAFMEKRRSGGTRIVSSGTSMIFMRSTRLPVQKGR